MGAWKILEAINFVLEASGDPPVNSITEDSSSSVAVVNRKLKEERLKVMSRGHTFNTTFPVLTPDINGHIAIGPEILSVDGFQEDAFTAFTVKEDKLFDVTNQTDIFTRGIHLKVISDMNFDDIRTQVQYQIMTSTAKSYQRQYQQDPVMDNQLVESEREAEVAVMEEELRGSNVNPKDGTPLGRILKGGLFGYD